MASRRWCSRQTWPSKPPSVSAPMPVSDVAGGPAKVTTSAGKFDLDGSLGHDRAVLVGHRHLQGDERHTEHFVVAGAGHLGIEKGQITVESGKAVLHVG